MRRREFIGLVAGATAVWPLGSHAQQGSKVPRVGILMPGHAEGPDASRAALNAMIEGLQELGYTEGQNIVFERRFGESNPDRLRRAAAELVERQVDVILAQSTTAARPAKQATSQIPIVAMGMADPVEDDLVASLARPGGNLTGTTFLGPWPGAGCQATAAAPGSRAAAHPRGCALASPHTASEQWPAC
jgi:putative ABC transport system substrate-binding protein